MLNFSHGACIEAGLDVVGRPYSVKYHARVSVVLPFLKWARDIAKREAGVTFESNATRKCSQ